MILNFLCLLALIIHELGLGDKWNWESAYVQKCNLKIILTCNIYIIINDLMQTEFYPKLHVQKKTKQKYCGILKVT